MTQSDEKDYIAISKRAILEAFIKRVYTQKNIQKLCGDKYPDYMVIPIDRFEDWFHDMGVVLGKAIQDVVDP